ncbi:uncharacterized protein [Macrobrachium rosenbergii]|uniref:uncharacterized protein n=1 Tax=Macrobrachium rosenbergii TaxID=79674 RepID=UPI0034D41CD5
MENVSRRNISMLFPEEEEEEEEEEEDEKEEDEESERREKLPIPPTMFVTAISRHQQGNLIPTFDCVLFKDRKAVNGPGHLMDEAVYLYPSGVRILSIIRSFRGEDLRSDKEETFGPSSRLLPMVPNVSSSRVGPSLHAPSSSMDGSISHSASTLLGPRSILRPARLTPLLEIADAPLGWRAPQAENHCLRGTQLFTLYGGGSPCVKEDCGGFSCVTYTSGFFRSCRKKNPTTSLANSSQGHRLSSISISSINEFSTDQQTVFHEPDERRDHSTATERPSTTECPGTNSQLNGNIFQKKNSRQIRRLQFRNKSPETGQRSESISRSSLLLTRTRSIGSLGTSMLESNYFSAAPGISLKSDGSPHDQSNLPVQKTGPCPPQGSFSSFVSSFVCSNSGEGVGGWSTSVVSSPLCIVSSTPVKTK